MDRRITVKLRSGRQITIDLPEGAPSVSDIHPFAWAQLVKKIEKANALAKQSTSETERQSATLEVLRSVLNFLMSVDYQSQHLIKLWQALKDVREGHEHPLLKPARTSRPKESSRLLAIKGCSAGVMEFLMTTGKKKSEAAKQVANVLAKTDLRLTRGGKKATAKTVAAWRDRCIGCSNDPAREDFEWMLRMLIPKNKPPTRAQTHIGRDPLGWLARSIKNRT
jgi:hypothetical protein